MVEPLPDQLPETTRKIVGRRRPVHLSSAVTTSAMNTCRPIQTLRSHWRTIPTSKSTVPSSPPSEFSFLQDWHWATGGTLTLPIVAPIYRQSPRQNGWGPRHRHIPSGPADDLETCTFTLLALINAAKSRLWIASPYFVPDRNSLRTRSSSPHSAASTSASSSPPSPTTSSSTSPPFPTSIPANASASNSSGYTAGFLHQKVRSSTTTSPPSARPTSTTVPSASTSK